MKIINQWTERDLTAEAKAGRLDPTFAMDERVDEIGEVIEAGYHPILTGESGVGKTAIMHELVRRSLGTGGPSKLRGRRILQLSLRKRASALEHPHQIVAEMQKLVEALRGGRGRTVVFIRDIHLAYEFDLEPQLLALACALDAPVLGEGRRAGVEAMIEYDQSLQELYVGVHIDEPDLARSRVVLDAWARHRQSRDGRVFRRDALDQALTLTHRFLSRSRLPRKALDLLRHTEAQTPRNEPITASRVVERFCAAHRTPRTLIDPAIPLDLRTVRATFTDRVMGQPEAVDAVVNTIGTLKAGLSDLRRPFGVFLFVGPTGVGKTLVAQVLAEYLFGHSERLVRFNMADFPAAHHADSLFGDPQGDNMSTKRGLLSRRLTGRPFGVILLDEFEKAHAKVHDRFLQLFDEGSFINGASETVACRSMIVIATSNAGAEVHRGQVLGFASGNGALRERTLRAALEAHFRFELLNRFDRIVHFDPLTRDDVRRVAALELGRLEDRVGIRQRGLSLEIADELADWLVDRGYDRDHGARMLRRTIERYVVSALGEVIVRENPPPGSRIALSVRGDEVRARVMPEARLVEAPAELGPVNAPALRAGRRKRSLRLLTLSGLRRR